MVKQYRYVGNRKILEALPRQSQRVSVQSGDDVLRWISDTHQQLEADDSVVATFIVDVARNLWINDRRSEHVLCADRQNVLSAGEITFSVAESPVEVIDVTNQSTGYCPEPESWWAVDDALNTAGIPHPDNFTTAFIFRRCEACGSTNIVKDAWFECAICGASLPQHWNYETIAYRG